MKQTSGVPSQQLASARIALFLSSSFRTASSDSSHELLLLLSVAFLFGRTCFVPRDMPSFSAHPSQKGSQKGKVQFPKWILMRNFFRAAVLILLLVTIAGAAPRTILLVGTTLQTGSASGSRIKYGQEIAQQFMLDVEAKWTSMTFVLGGSFTFDRTGRWLFGNDVPFLAQLTRGIGPGSIVLAQQQFTFRALPGSYYATTFTFEGPKALEPGTYYLVLSTTTSREIGSLAWAPQREIDSPMGRVGSAYCASPVGYDYPNEATFTPCTTSQTMQFQFIGKWF